MDSFVLLIPLIAGAVEIGPQLVRVEVIYPERPQIEVIEMSLYEYNITLRDDG
mgnify:CR=1 FL=1